MRQIVHSVKWQQWFVPESMSPPSDEKSRLQTLQLACDFLVLSGHSFDCIYFSIVLIMNTDIDFISVLALVLHFDDCCIRAVSVSVSLSL